MDLLKKYHQRTVLLFSALVIALGIWSFHTYRQSMDILRSRVLEQQKVLSIQAANGIDTHLHWLEMDLTRLSLAREWHIPDSSVWHLKLGEVLAFGRRVQVKDVQLIDKNGIILASAQYPFMEGQNQAASGFFQKASKLSSDRTVYEITTYHTGQKWEKGVIMARPIRDAGTDFNGVILFSLTLSDLLKKFLPTPAQSSGAIWLADEHGQIYHSDYPLGYPVNAFFFDTKAYHQLLREAQAGRNFTANLDDQDGQSQVVSVLPLQMAGHAWTIVVSTRGAEIADQTRHIFTDFLLFIVIAGGISLANLFFHTRMIAQTHNKLEQEIKVRKKLQQRMKHLAQHDSLTKLPNRWLFFDRLSQVLHRSHREREKAAVLFVDLDRFKQINDTLGHKVGDELLEAVANTMRACVRETDTIARLGGDEFGVVLSDLIDGEEARMVAQKIIDALAPPFEIQEHECQIGASIGIALYPDHGTDPNQLLQNADSAMYHAKSRGRNRSAMFRPDILSPATAE